MSNVIQHYKDNDTSGDIVQWLQKLVARLKKIKDLAGLLSLFLLGLLLQYTVHSVQHTLVRWSAHAFIVKSPIILRSSEF